MSRPMSQYHAAATKSDAAAASSSHLSSNRFSVYDTPSSPAAAPTGAPQHVFGHEDDEEDDEEDEDWNIYDDFNNVRPLPSAGTPNEKTAFHQDSEAGYWSNLQDATSPFNNPDSQQDIGLVNAGKNRTSLLPASAFGFDVKNSDPRNSMLMREVDGNLRTTQESSGDGAGYRFGKGARPTNASGIELITIPALGEEFTAAERSEMTRKMKRKSKAGKRNQKIKSSTSKWAKSGGKGSRGGGLLGWFTPRVAIWTAFVTLIILGILLYFVIPRVPSIEFLSTDPLDAVPDGASMTVTHYPTSFSMDMNLNLRADNSGGWLPSKAKNLKVVVTDVTTSRTVGKGNIDSISFPGRKRTPFKFPVHFSYSSLNATGDQTFLDFYNGCAPQYPNSPRPTLNLGVTLTMTISGLVGTKGSSTQLSSIVCPFTLQRDQ